jgi:hypothetical protein
MQSALTPPIAAANGVAEPTRFFAEIVCISGGAERPPCSFRVKRRAPAVLRQQATGARPPNGNRELRRRDARSYGRARHFGEHVAVEIEEFGVVDSAI